MSLVICAIGVATPPHAVAQSDAAEMAAALCCQTARQKAALPVLYRQSGVRRRYSVLLEASSNGRPATQSFYPPPSEARQFGPETSQRMRRYATEAAPLAAAAARAALEESGLQAADVTHLVTVSCTGFCAPGFDIALVRDLPLRPDVARTHVGFMGCHGALNALRVARSFVDSDPAACVLVCAVELCSLHQQYGWNPQQIVANALFSDGAAAVVGTSRQRLGREERSAAGSGSNPAWIVCDNASCVLPDSESMMSWNIGDHGFEMTLSPRLPDVIRAHLGQWLDGWLRRHGLRRQEIRSWAIHPGGPRILKAAAEAVGLDDDQLAPSLSVLADFGNMSSPTVLFVLQRLQQSGARPPCIALGFGPGLTFEAALLVESPTKAAVGGD